MLAKRILIKLVVSSRRVARSRMRFILLGIISCVSKYSEIEPPFNTITAGHNDAVFPSLDEVIIENDLPLCVYKLTMTEG